MKKTDSEKVKQVIEKHESEGRYFEVDGIKTFALDFGRGEPVFCIHGVPTSSFLYRKVIKAISLKNMRGICVDLPGLGFTARPDNFDYSFRGLADFLLKAADFLKIEKFHLVVHDIGGPTGFYLAGTHPDRISSITILNTWVDVVNFKKPLVMRPFEKPVLGEAEFKMITHQTWPIMFSKMGVLNHDKIPKEEINAYVDLLKREDNGKAFLKIMRSFNDSEEFREVCYKAIQNVPYPVQAIWGKDDPALTFDRYGNEIKEVAGLNDISLLPARHFLQEEVWKEIAEKIISQARGNISTT